MCKVFRHHTEAQTIAEVYTAGCMTKQIAGFELSSYGRKQYFLPGEEEMILQTIELTSARGFPYDGDNLMALATTMLQSVPKHKGKTADRGWLQCFEKRHLDR